MIGAREVKAKLDAAPFRIMETNRGLTTAMLEAAKPLVEAGTPLGPAHFGYHGRDTIRVEVFSKRTRTVGRMMAAVQLYWRERGTVRERRFGLAHKTVNAFRNYIRIYYAGGARWWRL